jgi:hypothetical protein
LFSFSSDKIAKSLTFYGVGMYEFHNFSSSVFLFNSSTHQHCVQMHSKWLIFLLALHFSKKLFHLIWLGFYFSWFFITLIFVIGKHFYYFVFGLEISRNTSVTLYFLLTDLLVFFHSLDIQHSIRLTTSNWLYTPHDTRQVTFEISGDTLNISFKFFILFSFVRSTL